MYQKTVIVKNATGLHARPAAMFIAEAKKFQSAITIGREGEDKTVNAKSMVKLLTLGICQNQSVVLSAEGEDEVAAIDTLAALIETFEE